MNQYLQPDEIACTNDPGDETQRRFRYQAAYAAIKCLSLLDDSSLIDCIYCEHHEDILVKHKDNSFIGLQVKTRASGQPFQANDEQVYKSIKKFVEHEIQFPRSFLHYVLVANCGFWKANKTDKNLNYILELANNCHINDLDKLDINLTKFIKTIDQEMGNTCHDISAIIIKTLQKTKLEVSPGLADIDAKLVDLISRVPKIKERELRYDQLNKITHELINKCLNAASLVENSPTEAYYILKPNPEDEKTKMIIQGKKIAINTILELVDEFSLNDQYLLRSSNCLPLKELPRGTTVMEKKMAAGGISLNNIELMKDNKISAEYGLIQLSKKLGKKKADQRYQHLITVVNNVCQEVHDLSYQDKELFGKKMLTQIRERLQIRYDKEKSELFGFRYEHCDLIFYFLDIIPLKVRKSKVEDNSPLVRLSFRDILWYCYLQQDLLDSSFYRLEDSYRKLKSRDVMRFVVGYYKERLNQLESELEETKKRD